MTDLIERAAAMSRIATCEGCKYWSERMAMVQGRRVVAWCLNADGVVYKADQQIPSERYTWKRCDKFTPGVPVDLL